MAKDPTETEQTRIRSAETFIYLGGQRVPVTLTSDNGEGIAPELLAKYLEGLGNLPTVTFDTTFYPVQMEDLVADQVAIDEAVALTEEDWERIKARLGELPNVTIHMTARPPERSLEYHTLLQTWAPQDPETAQRFRDQLNVAIDAETRMAQAYQLRVMGALSLALRDAQHHLAERAELLSDSVGMLEQASIYFEQVALVAEAYPDIPELQVLAARFRTPDDDDDDEQDAGDGS